MTTTDPIKPPEPPAPSPDMPDTGEPFSKGLQLLRGSVRPIVTLGGFTVLSVLTFMGKVDAREYAVIVSTAVAYWFGARNK